MRFLLPLLAASLLTLGFSVSSIGSPGPAASVEPPLPAVGPPRLTCERPRALRLRRFEDGSARLECGRRTLARVAVPG